MVACIHYLLIEKLNDIDDLPLIDFVKMDIQGSELTVLKNGLDNHMMIFDSIKINLRKVKLSFNPKCRNKC